MLQTAQLARDLPVDLLPDTPERPALVRLRSLVSGDHTVTGYAALRERLRGTPEETQVEEAAAELLALPFDEAEAEEEFRDAVGRLHEGDARRAFEDLQARAQKFGVSGLSAEEKKAYLDFLAGRRDRG